MTIINILKKVPIFKNIADKDLKKIENILKEKNYSCGEYIFMEMDEGKEFYIVSSGRIKIYKISINGRVKTLDYLEKGDFFGEMALIDKELRSANAMAMEDTTLCTISYDDFQKFLVNYPKILLTITMTLCQRLRKADKEIELFSFKDVKSRLISCFINLAEKYGESTDDGIRVEKMFTHQDLSELIGTAREVVSRNLRQLKKDGLIITDGNCFIFPSLPDLKKKIVE